jgi:replication factor C subunit 2/4
MSEKNTKRIRKTNKNDANKEDNERRLAKNLEPIDVDIDVDIDADIDVDIDLGIDVDGVFEGIDFVVVNKGRVVDPGRAIRDKRNTTWVDKYRPKKLDDIIGHDDVKKMLIKSIEQGDLPHLLFHGGSGTGKTSTVLALVMQLYGPARVNEKVLELNASDENGINVVRDKIIKFANIVVGSSDPRYPSPPFKIVILDEADSMTSEAQTALKKVMESTCEITRFVFICNYESRIIDAVKSRCADFRFSPIPDNLMIEKLKKIAADENMIMDDIVYRTITEICEGDARRSINTLQNLKYLSKSPNDPLTGADVYEITSHMGSTYLNPYWKTIAVGEYRKLAEIVTSITNSGYSMNCVLRCIKNKVMKSKLNGKKKALIMMHLGKIERMITSGSDNWIQLMAVLSYINTVFRGIDVRSPSIY